MSLEATTTSTIITSERHPSTRSRLVDLAFTKQTTQSSLSTTVKLSPKSRTTTDPRSSIVVPQLMMSFSLCHLRIIIKHKKNREFPKLEKSQKSFRKHEPEALHTQGAPSINVLREEASEVVTNNLRGIFQIDQ